MKALERRIERLEDKDSDPDERFDIGTGEMLTGAEIDELLRKVALSGNRI